jgi:CubicO group peptidase (beta-lactamase class C family)
MRFTSFASALALALAPVAAVADDQPAAAAADANTTIDAAGGMATIAVPPGWSSTIKGSATVLGAPEGDASFALVPIIGASDGGDAVAKAWASYDPTFARPVLLAQDNPGRNGWDSGHVVNYDVPPAEKRAVQAIAFKKGDGYLVVLVDGAIATIAKRGGQVGQAFGSLRPKGFVKESFAGMTAHPLDAARIAELKAFTRDAMTKLKVPGVGMALIDGGKVVWEGGLGVRDRESDKPVDADTRFMVASNTKGMATLMLATLVDQGKLDWNKPVTDYLPTFRLGSEETTKKVLVKHLVCACTGLPRKDMEWLFNTKPGTPATEVWTQLAATEPTSGFGEVFQYNNLMATAAGYLGAHVLYPDTELGAAFDRAMQERVFGPLGMKDTTLSNSAAMASGDWARPYGKDFDDNITSIPFAFNSTIAPYRPAGGAWSSAHDMALYVLDELTKGVATNGKRIVSEQNLLARRVHNAPIGENAWYGMGLMESRAKGIPVVTHGGDLFGYHSNWFAFPETQSGLVILTNSDAGPGLIGLVQRKLLEIMFDAKPEAAENLATALVNGAASRAKSKSEIVALTPALTDSIVGLYTNAALGPMTIAREDGKVTMRTTSITSELASRKNPDGSMSIVTMTPGFMGQDALVTTRDGKPAIVLDDGQHEYVWLKG